MKNKSLTYLLLAATVVLWSWIVYTVFDYTTESAEPTIQKHYTAKPVATVDKTIYALQLNYQDPFLKKEAAAYTSHATSGNASFQIKKTSPSVAVVKADPIPTKTIKYLGRIANKKSKSKPVAILSIEGMEYMMKEGETKQEVLLLKVLPDSVWIKSDNKKRYVRKEI